jgi:hypothetical protein
MKTIQLAILAGTLALATQSRATIIGESTISHGNSTDVTFEDGNYGGPITAMEAVIVTGNSLFDAPITVGDPGWASFLLNGGVSTFATGPANANNQTITLSFADGAPTSGIKVDFYYWNGSQFLGGDAWQYLNLTGDVGTTQNADWILLNPQTTPVEPTPVPEASTMAAGALMLLPLGASVARVIRRNRSHNMLA